MMGNGRAAAEAYIDAVNTRDIDKMSGLFAPEGRLLHPSGVYDTREEIREFYEGIVFAMQVKATIVKLCDDGNQALLEMTGEAQVVPDSPKAWVVDVFETNDAGKITTLAIYALDRTE